MTEINSSFHRPHRTEVYRRWADSVEADFRFAVKLPKHITHERRLIGVGEALLRFAEQIVGLGDRLRVVLIQLPPSLVFEPGMAADFLGAARAAFPAQLVLEPRHASWFSDATETLLIEHAVARVAADPPPVPEASVPGGWRGFSYFRLHGAPRIYRSDYGASAIAGHARSVLRVAETSETWVIYDNTASGAATGNALALDDRLRKQRAAASGCGDY